MTRQKSRSATRQGRQSPLPAEPELSPADDTTPTIPPAVAAIPVVGIGASAGGLDAFLRLLHHLPPNTGLAYVFVQHLHPTHESLLPELLGRASAIPVVQAVDDMRLDADHAYVIPPNATLTVTDGHLQLVARKKGPGPHLPVDAFLCSLADVHGSSAVGVILSGAGSDGAKGIQAIKEAGGITIAQESASAHTPSMPQSAIDTGAVDFILTPEEIAEQLSRLGAHLARHPRDAMPTSDGDDAELRKILALLHKRTGVDFRHYRRGTLHRRVLRRMLAHRQDTHRDYLAHVRLNPAELDVLYEDLLIGVTRFFRDPEVSEKLQTAAFADMMAAHGAGTPVRMWVAGCAGGEEAYSLAIALLEFLGDAAGDVSIQIFGTDLSEASIARARAGVYSERITDDVSPERLRRFFVAEKDGYRISKAVRDLCVFSRQNVVRDPPFSHLDLVSCRNVLIYLEPELQRRVFPVFHYALEPHGLLVLGSAESVGYQSEYFEPLAKRQGIYRRRAAATHTLDVDLASPPTLARNGAGRRGTPPPRGLAVAPSADEITSAADHLVLARFTPPGVVINEYM
jgi:two-component system, chemotaxis family, CheB/CheR fusion protein